MTPDISVDAAFGRPGGESCLKSEARPIDLAHLSRQTLGDREVEQEVLGLFAQEAKLVRERFGKAEAAERARMMHRLKGAAGGVGAFAIARCAAAIEARPRDEALRKSLAGLIDEVLDFIASISR